MAKVKKKLSKKAKEALRILEESKLMNNSKAMAAAKVDKTVKPNDTSAVTTKAHKPRPNKKRG